MRSTRVKELTYDKVGNNWRIFQADQGEKPGVTGPIYRSKAELLCDLERVIQEWGY
jgi:hypothetical protein